jgi:hypothetical protein
MAQRFVVNPRQVLIFTVSLRQSKNTQFNQLFGTIDGKKSTIILINACRYFRTCTRSLYKASAAYSSMMSSGLEWEPIPIPSFS